MMAGCRLVLVTSRRVLAVPVSRASVQCARHPPTVSALPPQPQHAAASNREYYTVHSIFCACFQSQDLNCHNIASIILQSDHTCLQSVLLNICNQVVCMFVFDLIMKEGRPDQNVFYGLHPNILILLCSVYVGREGS